MPWRWCSGSGGGANLRSDIFGVSPFIGNAVRFAPSRKLRCSHLTIIRSLHSIYAHAVFHKIARVTKDFVLSQKLARHFVPVQPLIEVVDRPNIKGSLMLHSRLFHHPVNCQSNANNITIARSTRVRRLTLESLGCHWRAFLTINPIRLPLAVGALNQNTTA